MKWSIICLQTILISSLPLCSAPIRRHNTTFISGGKKIRLEEHCASQTPSVPAAVIFLHGSGGPNSANLPYTDEEKDLAKRGYCVYVPYYLDSTGGLSDNPRKQYPVWVKVVEDAVGLIFSRTGTTKDRIALVGYSLGASVALGVGAKDENFGAIIDFSGSLPDEYLSVLKTLPPLLIIHGRDDQFVPLYNALQLAKLCDIKGLICDVQLYPGEGHFFSIAAMIKSKREVEEFLKDHVPVGQAEK